MSNNEIITEIFNDQEDDVIIIVDRSGSMASIKEDAEGGVNSFISDQKKLDKATTITLAEFDDKYDKLYDRIDINEVSDYVLKPRGMTALYDAIGYTLSGFEQNDNKKIVVIVTDGGENSSKEYNKQTIFEMITDLKSKGWQFVFLAANQDAMKTGSGLGINPEATINFDASGAGVHDGYAAVSTYTSSLRTKSYEAAVADLNRVKAKSTNIS